MPTKETTHDGNNESPLPGPANLWNRMEKWQQIAALALATVASLFGAGVSFQRARAAIVMVSQQKPIDERQDAEIRAVVDDAGKIHVTIDHLHEDVLGMRQDLRFFDPRIRGGGLPELRLEPPLATPSATPVTTPMPGTGP